MDLDTIRLNVINVFALSLQMMDVEKVVAISVGITALVYNLLKIYSWLKTNGKI